MYKENYEQKNGRKKLDICAENVQNEQNRVGEKNPVTMQATMADKPVQRTSLREKLEAFKAKMSGTEKHEKHKENNFSESQ